MIERKFADGTYNFHLGFDEAVEWERSRQRSLFATMMTAVKRGEWDVKDMAEVIRLGLIGGGMGPAEAVDKVEFYVKKRPLAEYAKIAVDTMVNAYFGSGEAHEATDA